MRRFLVAFALVLGAVGLSGCVANQGAIEPGRMDGAPSVVAPPLPRDEAADSAEQQLSPDRQVITTGHASIAVDDPIEAADEAVRITESIGGRVDSRSEHPPLGNDQGSASVTLRIPADQLTRTLEGLKDLGETESVEISAVDVTVETQDLDARIAALQASVDRLLALLATASDTEVLIQIESALSQRQGELDSLQAQRRYYADQVSMSTLTVNFISAEDAPSDTPETFWSGIVAGWQALVAFFSGALVVLGVALPWIGLLAVLGLLALLAIRLIRRRRSREGTTSAAPESGA